MARRTRRQSDLFVFGIDAKNAEFHLLSELHCVLRLGNAIFRKLRNMTEAFEVIAQFYKRTKARETGNLSFHQIAGLVSYNEVIPRIRFEILNRKRHAPVLRIDTGDNRFDLLALLQNLSGMLDATRPRNVRNMNQAVDAILDLDESAEIG